MSKAAIPVVNTGNPEVDQAHAAIKQNMDQMTGQQKNVVKLVPLASTASTADIINRLNALLDRLQ